MQQNGERKSLSLLSCNFVWFTLVLCVGCLKKIRAWFGVLSNLFMPYMYVYISGSIVVPTSTCCTFLVPSLCPSASFKSC